MLVCVCVQIYTQACSTCTSVSISCRSGITPLSCASQRGHVEVAEILIANGAQVDLPDKVSVRVGDTVRANKMLPFPFRSVPFVRHSTSVPFPLVH